MLKLVEKLTLKYYDKIVRLRHQIHMHPELEFEEENTAHLVCEILDEFGIKYQKNIAKTGILAIIEGKKTSSQKPRCVLLRADMDALPVQEKTQVDYASKIEGKMHACGHDGHTAGLLGAALVLNELREEFCGVIKFMFQPAEEGSGGAKPMIDSGVLENPHVDAVFGCHLWGALLENTAQIVSGEMMVGSDIFDLEFIGRGGHGAHPHTCIDPIIMASQFINNIQSVVSRRLAPYEAGVITVGQINAGTTYNVIPAKACLKGTVRFLNDKTQNILKDSLEQVALATAKSNGGDYKLSYTQEFPPLINDEKAALIARKAFAKILGEERIITQSKPDMGAEDFAFLTQERMGAYVFVGISKDLNKPVLHHSPYFCWDDENLKVLMQADAMMALEFLNS
ncbi:M20 family metallopeptidase [Campylobacter sp. VicNov18]|uniref:M20 metallopeptidase family protein n=1 Tax=Campylobacter bilis TaxID=2691918 RepID=UPI00130D4E3F|nr:M20 family metallopeptidase [Campylobacter bilis]MPV63408.1 amidohydrolase [Campylobacter hepaticus]MBM0636907.1 amidohydrolase [Campylobacter bilis]MCC8277616.1 M20 family metallopeptidase [Campylobacter bilis]MCC8299225.1 M20 family metallopeptidase [Campylobacter bilis]MCC8300525.1 M20 family metallopeptidase [Campylobacter bilis]